MAAVAALDPISIFHEPINIRGKNVKRIAAEAAEVDVKLRTEVHATPQQWRHHAIGALTAGERLAEEASVFNRLKLWPDESLGTKIALRDASDPRRHERVAASLVVTGERMAEQNAARSFSATTV